MDTHMQEAEQRYLDRILSVITDKLEGLNSSVDASQRLVLEQKKTMWSDIYEMDRREMVYARAEIDEEIDKAILAEANIEKLGKQYQTPYFGRIDFTENGVAPAEFYIGLAGLRGKDATDILVYDWRAPVSSMFYDCDVGSASYEAPDGIIEGELTLRRQYKISGGKLDYIVDSDVKIDDDILQKELSKSASPYMKNIIATIQREQNRIIRAKAGQSLIVQGVAGSGKTSVALHKIAFLLYNQRGKITSKNLLILSPSKVFSNYISHILPELGEENVNELSFDALARNEIGDLAEYEERWEQLEYILTANEGDRRLPEIELKSTIEYAGWIAEYVRELEQTNFKPKTYKYGEEEFEAEYFADLFWDKWSKQPFMVRIGWICERVIDELEFRLKKELGKRARGAVENAVSRMIRCDDILVLYSRFIEWLRQKGYADLLPVDPEGKLTYEDTFPVVLMKYYLQGSRDFSRIRHLVIDEMQDYSPVQYEIINYLFKCSKTILGDITQNLNLHSGIRSLDEFSGDLGAVEVIRLSKSFRSTCEIAEFANSICPVEGFEVVQRHGEEPQISGFESELEKNNAIITECGKALSDGFNSVAVICKTIEEAEAMYGSISGELDADFLGPYSEGFDPGVIVTTSYMAKGLEFDAVIVPNCDNENYRTDTDRQFLYVACTRALHRLRVFHCGARSELINYF